MNFPSKLTLCFIVLLSASTTQAAITTIGEVSPEDTSTWDGNFIAVSIGDRNEGVLLVDNGSDIACGYAYLGMNSGSSGIVTVSGSGSTWNCAHEFTVGNRGSGTLNVTNGGTAYSGLAHISQ